MGLKSRFGFTDEDKQRGVSSLEDRPKCSAAELKSAFDLLCTQVIMPRINDLLDFLDSDSLMGSTMVDYGGEKVELQEAVTRLRSRLETLKSTNGAANVGAMRGEVSTTVQSVLNFILDKIESMELGAVEIPAGGITTSKLASDCKAPFAGTADYVNTVNLIHRYAVKGSKQSKSIIAVFQPIPYWCNDPSYNIRLEENSWLLSKTGGWRRFRKAGIYRLTLHCTGTPPGSLTDANNTTEMVCVQLLKKDADDVTTVLVEDYIQMHNQHGHCFSLCVDNMSFSTQDMILLNYSRSTPGVSGSDEIPDIGGYLEMERLGD